MLNKTIEKIDLIKLAYLGLKGLMCKINNESQRRVWRYENRYGTNWCGNKYNYFLIEEELKKGKITK